MSQVTGKHIRLYLVDGSPTGILTAEIMGWTGKVLSFPRGLLPEALKRPECAKTGLYFLSGFDDEQTPMLYIGESDDVAKRLKQHDSDEDKAFFEQVTLVVSKDENLTKGHVRYLENRLIEIARKNGMNGIKNSTQGSASPLPEAEQSDMEYLVQQLRILLPVLGLTLLQEVPQKRQKLSAESVHSEDQSLSSPQFELIMKNSKIHAEAYEQDGQFIVQSGAICQAPKGFAKSFSGGNFNYIINDIKESIDNKTLIEYSADSNYMQLARDKAFKSPSGAAMFVCGSSKNGRTYWKVKGADLTYGDWRQAQLEQAEPQPERQEVAV